MTARRVTAVVLAGGRSSRFGRDKLAEPVAGRPLLDHAINAVRPFATEVLVISSPDGSPAVAGDVRVVHDPSPFEGPLMGLAAGLDQAQEATVLVTAGDIPELVPGVVELLLGALDAPGSEVAVLGQGDWPAPFPMAIRRDVARTTIARLIESGERRLFPLIDALARTVIEEPVWRTLDPEGRSIHDIDT
ncbi:MAG: molybdenum cofactor guanylyltransferase, partial [Chloroflexota bacterium]